MPVTTRARSAVVLTTTALTAVGLVGAVHVAPAGAASGTTVRNHALTSGIKVSVRDFRLGGRREHAVLMTVDLNNRHLRVDSLTPENALGAKRQTATTLVHRDRAVAGINTAFFDMAAKNATPRDGVIRAGRILKTPRQNWNANLYVTSKGQARIGRVVFRGSVTRAARGKTKAARATIYGVNSLGDLQRGRATLLTPALVRPDFDARCAVAFGHLVTGKRVVTRSFVASSMRRLRTGEFAVVSCGKSPNTTWLRTQVRPHDRVTLATAIVGGAPRTLVSGGNKLVDRGKRYNDVGGKVLAGNPRNPETFACASRNGRSLLLGTIDGRQKASAGVTYGELAHYMLTLHCWSGLVFDGGGSTTIVGRSSTRATVRVLNRPSGGVQRAIPAGLSVSRH